MSKFSPHFQDARHALYAGWLLGTAAKHGIPVAPVVDEHGNYEARVRLLWTPLSSPHKRDFVPAVYLVIPYPPEDWTLSDD